MLRETALPPSGNKVIESTVTIIFHLSALFIAALALLQFTILCVLVISLIITHTLIEHVLSWGRNCACFFHKGIASA